MSKSLKSKVDELAKRFGVVRGTMNADQFRSTVKAKAGYPDESIEVIYDKVFNAPDVRSSEHSDKDRASVENTGSSTVATTVRTAPAVEVLPPLRTADTDAGAVRVHVHTPPAVVVQNPVVSAPRPDSLAGVAPSIAAWCQTLALGLVVGVLISKPILKLLGH